MMIIEEDRAGAAPHSLLDHPLASDLMESVVRWINRESLGEPALEELADLRSIASRMLSK
jgi:hypothetical protein